MTSAVVLSSHWLIAVCLVGCSYSNSTPAGRTVADDRTIEDIRKAIVVLDVTPRQHLAAVAEESSRKDISYTGIRIKTTSANSFEFFCWLPCKDHELIQNVKSPDLPRVDKITTESSEGRTVIERWSIQRGSEREDFQVRFFRVPGGGGSSFLMAVFASKPDHMDVRRIQ
jgi:hypothetical protein